MAIDTGIPMSVLEREPDEYLSVMFKVMERRAEQAAYGPDSKPWDE